MLDSRRGDVPDGGMCAKSGTQVHKQAYLSMSAIARQLLLTFSLCLYVSNRQYLRIGD